MFPRVTLSAKESASYETLVRGIIKQSLNEYDQYVANSHRQVDKQTWKAVKSRENLTVYKERGHKKRNKMHFGLVTVELADDLERNDASVLTGNRAVAVCEEWSLPKLLTIGTVAGTLDDVMYGITTPDVPLMLLKAACTQDEVVDGEILHQIQGPTPEEPFRFLGLKWLVKGNPAVVKAMVWERDLILVEATGILHHNSGDNDTRLGYFVMHSVPLSSCRELPDRSMQRGRISTCYLFKQLPHGLVDVFMTGHVQANGKIVDAVALISAANGLLCCWKAVECATNKKLVWLLDHHISTSNEEAGHQDGSHRSTASRQPGTLSRSEQETETNSHNDDSCCGVCGKNWSRFHHSYSTCALCQTSICGRCRIVKSVYVARWVSKQIAESSCELCKRCLTHTKSQNSFDIARQEVLSGRFGEIMAVSAAHYSPGSIDYQTTSVRRRTTSSGSSAQESIDGKKLQDLEKLVLSTPPDDYNDIQQRHNNQLIISSKPPSIVMQIENEFVSSPIPSGQYVNTDTATEEQKLWERMTQLQQAAENVYQYTKQTTNRLVHQVPAVALPPPATKNVFIHD